MRSAEHRVTESDIPCKCYLAGIGRSTLQNNSATQTAKSSGIRSVVKRHSNRSGLRASGIQVLLQLRDACDTSCGSHIYDSRRFHLQSVPHGPGVVVAPACPYLALRIINSIVGPRLYCDVASGVSLYVKHSCQTGWMITHLCTVHVGVAVVVTRRLVIVQISGSSENLACEQRALAYVTVDVGSSRRGHNSTNDIFAIPRQRAVRFADNTSSIGAVSSLQVKVSCIAGMSFIV